MVGIGRGSGDPRRHGAGLVDPLLQHLTLLVLAVIHQLIGIFGLIQLTERGVDPQLAEHAFHTEGPRFVWNDRYDAIFHL